MREGLMLTLINANRMQPPIAPVGLDYLAGSARRAGLDVEVVDLCLAADPAGVLAGHFAGHSPELVGISFRNLDDCFWPGASWFVPELAALVESVRRQSDAPIVLGGVGYSIFARDILLRSRADFGIRGDGEQTLVALVAELRGPRRFDKVDGLVWRADGAIRENRPAWPRAWSAPTGRDTVDNRTYFRRGGQIGVETRRGCPRKCLYCADPLAKGAATRLRNPVEVAEEIESLVVQGADVLHLCDSEFNVPADHARAVCEELIRRRLGERVRWYAYLAVIPFDAELARLIRRAGCVGINFTADSACAAMLETYRQAHGPDDLAQAVRLCRAHGMAVMFDLLLGGPGETPRTVRETIEYLRKIDPDCAGAALGVRLYPGTAMAELVAAEEPLENSPAIHRRYQGPIDLVRPTFYVSPALGQQPARLVRDLIAGDPRFFAPADEAPPAGRDAGPRTDHNYNDNQALVDAIAAGARGAYWDILRRLRTGRNAMNRESRIRNAE
jgi:radical SAM superfamily enzyme YgiQ (UPF0313 family)